MSTMAKMPMSNAANDKKPWSRVYRTASAYASTKSCMRPAPSKKNARVVNASVMRCGSSAMSAHRMDSSACHSPAPGVSTNASTIAWCARLMTAAEALCPTAAITRSASSRAAPCSPAHIGRSASATRASTCSRLSGSSAVRSTMARASVTRLNGSAPPPVRVENESAAGCAQDVLGGHGQVNGEVQVCHRWRTVTDEQAGETGTLVQFGSSVPGDHIVAGVAPQVQGTL